MKILIGLSAAASGVWFAAENRRLGAWAADLRGAKSGGRKGRVRVLRVLYVLGGLYLVLYGIALVFVGWKEFK